MFQLSFSTPKPTLDSPSIRRPGIFIGLGVGVFALAIMAYIIAWLVYLESEQKAPVSPQADTPGANILTEEIIAPPQIVEESEILASISTPRYMANAAPVPPVAVGTPKIALILDDLGLHTTYGEALLKLPREITFSFLPGGEFTHTQATSAWKRGHEIMVHLPMEPMPHGDAPPMDPGPNGLKLQDSLEKVTVKTKKNLDALKEIAVGVNNHMGSAFTQWREGMLASLSVIGEEGLFFLDSLTTGKSVGREIAAELSLPFLARDVFIDHFREEEKILSYLEKLETVARKQGSAIGIGHPHPETLEVLREWLETLPEKDVRLVPITTLLNTTGRPVAPLPLVAPAIPYDPHHGGDGT